MHIALIGLTAVVVLASQALAAERMIPPAFGPHTHPTPADFTGSLSFTNGQRLVGTYYFYWYCEATGEHMVDGDGSDALTDHPAAGTRLDYRSVAWHREELEDMIAAGIDVVLPVFWGSPAEHATNTTLHWSFAGLGPLVAAREELLREGCTPPRIGLFYDTSTLQHNAWNYRADLTTDFGKEFFYATIRDFFSCIPAKHWAMIEGRPIVLLYSPAFALRWDQSLVEFTKQAFARDFSGRQLWLAPQDAWQVHADAVCAWGGALGLRNPGIAALGPGYDHSAVPGREPLVVAREDGQFYERQWLKFLRRPSNFVMLETWNELHEGTDLCESREYGRQYITLTRRYVDRFKQGWRPPPVKGPFTGQQAVSLHCGTETQEQGIRWVDWDDGRTRATSAGRATVAAKPDSGSYVYFVVDDSFKASAAEDLVMEMSFHDEARGRLVVEFDGSDASAPFAGAYSRSADVATLQGDGALRTARFRLPQAILAGGQNGGADLRLVVQAPALRVVRVKVSREGSPPEAKR